MWQPWYSLETLKFVFSVFSEYQGCHTDGLSVSVYGGKNNLDFTSCSLKCLKNALFDMSFIKVNQNPNFYDFTGKAPPCGDRARHLFFPQLVRRTTIKQYGLVRNRNPLGHDDDILPFSKKNRRELYICIFNFYIKITVSESHCHILNHWCSSVEVFSIHFDVTGTRNTFQWI